MADFPFPPFYLYTQLTPPLSTDFTIINQGTNTITDTPAGIYITGTAASDAITPMVISAPSTPYSMTTLWVQHHGAATYRQFGMCFRDSGTGKLQQIEIHPDTAGTNVPGYTVVNYNSPTSYNATAANYYSIWDINVPTFLKVYDDGTTVHYYVSRDGVSFFQLYSVAKASGFLGATGYNQVGLTFDPANSNGLSAATCLHWQLGTS